MFEVSVGTEQTSLNYMKRLTAVAISNILYLRSVFPEDCYGHRKLENLKLRILTDKCIDERAKKLVQWVKGCFDAMEKKYLKQLILAIYDDESNPEQILESYSFQFTYEPNKMNISVSKGDQSSHKKICEESVDPEVKQSTVKLLRTLLVMTQSLENLPNPSFVTIKLLYYDEITPPDYEPPSFMAAESDTFEFKGKPMSVKAGEVVTPFHALKVVVRTDRSQFDDNVGSDSSDRCDNPKVSQELYDHCDSLPNEDNDSDEENSNKGSLNRGSKLKSQKTEKADEQQNRWLTPALNKEKTRESNAITTKMKDMKVDDSSQQMKGLKRKDYLEVTQDSTFSTKTDKKCKASEPKDQKIRSKKRRF